MGVEYSMGSMAVRPVKTSKYQYRVRVPSIWLVGYRCYQHTLYLVHR